MIENTNVWHCSIDNVVTTYSIIEITFARSKLHFHQILQYMKILWQLMYIIHRIYGVVTSFYSLHDVWHFLHALLKSFYCLVATFFNCVWLTFHASSFMNTRILNEVKFVDILKYSYRLSISRWKWFLEKYLL